MSDTPIYDQLRQELSSGRARQEGASRTRHQTEATRTRRGLDTGTGQPVVPAARSDSSTRRTVSVWSLVNRDK